MNSHKKKLFLCITKSNWGGAQKYVYDLATNMPKDSYDVTVLLGGNGELKNKLEHAGIRIISLKNSERDINAFKEIKLFFELVKIFRHEKPDIIHLNSSKMSGTGALAGRLTGINKIIFTGHGWAFNEDRPWWQKIIIKKLSIITILLSHKSIAVSQITKDQIGSPWNKKMIVVRNGFRPNGFKNKAAARDFLIKKITEINSELKDVLSKNPSWIGTISELHKTKGLNYAIEAVSKIENIIFVIIGEGEEKMRLENLIKNLKLSKKVFLAGKIEAASAYLKAFDIFTLTSITEALPYALIEAGAAGLPIVASNVGGIPEIIDNNKSGLLIEPKNSENIKTAIEKILNNREMPELFGSNIKQKIEKDFGFDKMISETMAVYKNN